MYVKIRTTGFRLFLPVPIRLAGFVIKCLPTRLFDEMQVNTPEPYRSLVTKQTIEMMVRECLDILKENKGLEIVHVEAADGTFVSIRL